MLSLCSKWIFAVSILTISSLNNAQALASTGVDGGFSLNHALVLNASNNQIFNFTNFDLQSGGVLDFSGLSYGDSISIIASNDIHLDGILNLSSNLTFETKGSVFVNGTINVGQNVFSLIAASTINLNAGSAINTNVNTLTNGGNVNLINVATDKPILSDNSNSAGINVGAGSISLGGCLFCNDKSITSPPKMIGVPVGGQVLISDFPIISGASSPTPTTSLIIGGLTLVPEPSSYALLLAGISLFILRRNKLSN